MAESSWTIAERVARESRGRLVAILARKLGDLHAAMASIAGTQFDIISSPVDEDSLGTIVLYPRRCARDVAALLGRSQVNRVRLPRRFEGMPLRERRRRPRRAQSTTTPAAAAKAR